MAAAQTQVLTTKDGQHVAVCFVHMWSAIPGPDKREAAFTCPVCAGEAEAALGRERFAVLWARHASAAVLALILTAGAAVAVELPEGVLLPFQATPHPVEVANRPAGPCFRKDTQRWEPCGPSKWVFRPALIAQIATVVTQEWAYAKFHVYGANIGGRLRAAALNLAPVVAPKLVPKLTGKEWPRSLSDATVAPSVGFGVWGTVRNVRDIRKIDALLRGSK